MIPYIPKLLLTNFQIPFVASNLEIYVFVNIRDLQQSPEAKFGNLS